MDDRLLGLRMSANVLHLSGQQLSTRGDTTCWKASCDSRGIKEAFVKESSRVGAICSVWLAGRLENQHFNTC